jgi:hypothetical protein
VEYIYIYQNASFTYDVTEYIKSRRGGQTSPEELEFQLEEEAKILEGSKMWMHAPSIPISFYTRAFGSVSSGHYDCQVFACSIDFYCFASSF